MIVDTQTGTAVDEVADGIYRIHVPFPTPAGDFSFNQYLVKDDEPLLFHTGPRRMFPLVRAAVSAVLPPEGLRWLAFAHVEDDECGSMNEWLGVAPHATPIGSRVAAMTSGALFDRPTRALADGEALAIGRKRMRWIDAPSVPHNWENGFLLEETTRTLLCGDLFTQPGAKTPALVQTDILGPSEEMRRFADYYAHSPETRRVLERLGSTEPRVLACMHGSAWQGDGRKLLLALADAVDGFRGAHIR